MGKKSTPKVPEQYDLQELLKYNTDLNRFNSYNPFGSQTWSEDPSGQWSMTQSINPEMQEMLDSQMDFVKQGPTRRDTPQPMQDMYQTLMDKRAEKIGTTPGYSPDVPPSSSPIPPPRESMMPGQGAGTGEDAVRETGFVMPGHSTPDDPGWRDRMADALGSLNSGQYGQNGYGIGSAMAAAAPGIKKLMDRRG